jgi:hypothetical protein
LRFLETARVFDHAALGVGDEVSKANVDTNSLPFPLRRRLPKVADDQNIPMSVGAKYKVSALGGSFERAVQFYLQASAEFVGDVQPLRFAVEEHVPPPTLLPKLYGVPAVGALKAWEANFAPEFFATKEALEGFVKPVGKRLHRALRNALAAPSLEPIRKIVAAKELARLIVMSG